MADFKARQDALDQKAATLLADYKTLLDDIQASKEHYKEFRRLKETVFALDKLSKRNGLFPAKKERSATAPTGLFTRKSAAPAERSATAPAKTPPNLFDRAANMAKKTEAPAVENPAPPNLFTRKKVSPPHDPIPAKKSKPAKDPKRKVLATSEEKED